MLVFCWNPVVSVLLVLVRRPLVPRPPYFLCRVGGITTRLFAETSQVVVSLALGIFSFPIDLDCKPLLECSCIIPGDVENAMTAFSLTTRDIVEAIHLDATAFIGTHSCLDEGVPRWALPILALKRRIWQRFPMFCYAVARSSQLTSLVSTIKIWRSFQENTCV